MIHETRVIPVGGQPRLGSKIRQYLGDSRGRWDGATLAIATSLDTSLEPGSSSNTEITSSNTEITEA